MHRPFLGYLAVVPLTVFVIAIMQGCSFSGSPNTRMQEAVERGDLAEVKRLVGTDPSLVNCVFDNDAMSNQPILSRAIELKHKAIAEFLIRKGCNVNTPGVGGWYPLHFAAHWGDSSIIKLLISKGGALNTLADGDTPLVIAAEFGNENAANALILAGANVNIRGSGGLSPLDYAVKNALRSTHTLLKKSGCAAAVPPVLVCSAFGDLAGISRELKRDPALIAKIGVHGWRPLNYAARAGQMAAVKLLLSKGAMADAEALECAVDSTDVHTVQVLLNHGCAINGMPKSNCTAVVSAVINNDPKMVAYLLKAGADPSIPSSDGRNAEELARSYGYNSIVKLFASHRSGVSSNP